MNAPRTAEEIIAPCMPLILDAGISREEKLQLICRCMREYAVGHIQVLSAEIQAAIIPQTLPAGEQNK